MKCRVHCISQLKQTIYYNILNSTQIVKTITTWLLHQTPFIKHLLFNDVIKKGKNIIYNPNISNNAHD